MINILANASRDACSGCNACVNACPCNAISVAPDGFGFDYPYIDEEKCIKCRKCVTVCELFQKNELHRPIKAFAVANKDEKTVAESASGGAFSALAEYVLSISGAVCGCVYDDELMPMHICTELENDVVRMRKSKYAQSNVGLIYRDVLSRLKSGQTVLFTGTPCQISGLYSFVGKAFPNLITADLICHGVPSRLVFKRFLEYLERKHKTKIVSFDFRSKKYGWQRYTLEFQDSRGRRKNIGKLSEFYMDAFTGGNILRQCCYDCRFAGAERVADFTMGDFWGHDAINLDLDRKKGISVLTFNTPHAIELTEALSSRLVMQEIDYDLAVAGNTCLRHPTARGAKRELYMRATESGDISSIAKRYRAKNRKKILRSFVKLHTPMWILNAMSRCKIKRRSKE